MEKRTSNDLVKAAAVLGGLVLLASIVLMAGTWILVDRSVGRIEAAMHRTADTASQNGEALRASIIAAIDGASQRISRPYVELGAPEPLKVRGVSDDGGIPVSVDMSK